MRDRGRFCNVTGHTGTPSEPRPVAQAFLPVRFSGESIGSQTLILHKSTGKNACAAGPRQVKP